ncbi:hypothetical protein P3T76_014558 [Phytophthora citrophthora]|uniref:Uncharacterized protein n=1 Tax=Phytophthora citrophthora TaxID=4793 RepID=A0AAD9G0Z5_9STRA|nr:hypothetical protein P3T76_014558 [Phytophthora citrophthora]
MPAAEDSSGPLETLAAEEKTAAKETLATEEKIIPVVVEMAAAKVKSDDEEKLAIQAPPVAEEQCGVDENLGAEYKSAQRRRRGLDSWPRSSRGQIRGQRG